MKCLDEAALSTYITQVKAELKNTKEAVQGQFTDKANVPGATLITLKVSGWGEDERQTATVAGVSADENAQLIRLIPHKDSRAAYREAGVWGVAQQENGIVFEAYHVPETDLKVWAVVCEVTDVTPETPEPEGETWVINETPQNSGIVNEGDSTDFDLGFRSNNETFTTVSFWFPDSSLGFRISYLTDSDEIIVYNDNNDTGDPTYVWTNEAYRTIIFSAFTPPTGNLLTWLQANAVKQT